MAVDEETSDPRLVISSGSEKSLSFAVRRSMFGTSKWETCYPQTFEHRPALPTDPIEPIETAPSSFSYASKGDTPHGLTLNLQIKRRCEITIISFSRSICRGRLAALIRVTGKSYPSCLSCHSHPIRPCGAPSPRGEGCDTRIPSSKKSGEAATRALNPEPNESKVKRGCEEMNLHFFTAPFYFAGNDNFSVPENTI